MKTYENEQMFVSSFAKDAKSELKNGQNFEAEVNGATIVVSGMDNNNASKVTIYKGSVNGIEFSGSITALKKRMNITYTKQYNRSAESSTKVTIKSDNELTETAKRAADRIKNAWEIMYQATQRYGLSRADLFERLETVESLILETLKRQRDTVVKEREAEAKRRAEETAKKIEAEKAKLEKQLAELQAKLAKMQ